MSLSEELYENEVFNRETYTKIKDYYDNSKKRDYKRKDNDYSR